MPSVREEQRDGEREQEGDLLCVERMLAEDLEDIGQERYAGAEERKPNEVDRVAALGPVIRH